MNSISSFKRRFNQLFLPTTTLIIYTERKWNASSEPCIRVR